MTTATINLPRETIEREQYRTDVWYEDLDEEVEQLFGRKKDREADNDD